MKRPLRVILFEDNPEVRNFVEKFFELNGCEVLVYDNPNLCLLQHSHECQCSKNECCTDIILTDIDMPSVTGIDFIFNLLDKGCKIQHVAIMSGAWTQRNRDRARQLGCTIFEKPIKLSTLHDWINKCTEKIDLKIALSNWFLTKNEN